MSAQNQAADAADAAATASEVKQDGTDLVERDASTALSNAAWTPADSRRSITAPNAVETLNRLESDGTMARLFGGNVNWEGEKALTRSKGQLDTDGNGTLSKTELEALAGKKEAPALDRFKAQYLLKNWKSITGSDTAPAADDSQIRTFAQKQQLERDALVRRQIQTNVKGLTGQFEQLAKLDPASPQALKMKADIDRELGTSEYDPRTRSGRLNRAALAQNLIDKDLGGLVAKDQLTSAATAGPIKMSDISIMSTQRDLKGLAAEIIKRDHFKVDTDLRAYDTISTDNLNTYAKAGETKYRPNGVPAVTVDTTVATRIGGDVQKLATSVQGLLANPSDTTLQATINEALKEYPPGSPKHTALMTELEKRGADGRLIQSTLGQDFWSGNAITSWLRAGFTREDLAKETQKTDNPLRSLAASLAQRNFDKIQTGAWTDRIDGLEMEAYAQKENSDLNLASNGARTDSSLKAANNSRDVLANPDIFNSANIDAVDNALKRSGNLDDAAARRRVADAMRDRGLDGKLVERAFKDSGNLTPADLERIANDKNAPPSQRVAAEIAKSKFTEIQKANNITNWDIESLFRDGKGITAEERKTWGDSQIVSAAPLRRTEAPVDKSADAIRALSLGYADTMTNPAERQRLEKAATDSLRNWFPVGTAPNTNVEDLAKGVTKADVDTLLATNWDKMFPGKTNFTRQDLARLASDNNPLTRATAQLAARQYASTLTSDTATVEKSAVAPASVESLVASETQRDQRRGVVKSMALTETAESLKAKMFSGTFDTTKPDVSKPRAEAMAALLRQANKDVPETGRQNPVNIDVDLGDGKKTRMQLTRERIGPDNWMIAAFVNGKPVMRAIDTQGDIFQQSEPIGSQTREVRMFEDRFKDMKAYQPPEAVTANPVVTTGDVVTDANTAMSDRAKALHAMDNGATVTVTVNGKDVQATVVKKGTWVGLMMPATDGKKPGFILKADVRRDGKVTPDGGQWTQNSWRDTGPEKWSYR